MGLGVQQACFYNYIEVHVLKTYESVYLVYFYLCL
jgi:hypothetical protein